MIFLDASALIAITAGEPDADSLADRMERDRQRLCSAMSIWETVAGLCRSHMFSIPSARDQIRRFLNEAKVEFVTIGESEYETAADAYAHFGKGRHPAALNMGDCFAYACTRSNRARLLFKGDDFGKTDIEIAD
jgi:ribonuclease VapC